MDEEKTTSSLARAWGGRRVDAGIGGLSTHSCQVLFAQCERGRPVFSIAPANVDVDLTVLLAHLDPPNRRYLALRYQIFAL